MQYIDKLYGVEALYVRAKAFYTAPVAKFCLTLILYMIFLCFHRLDNIDAFCTNCQQCFELFADQSNYLII